jgi:NAD(P)-dependent dehydrogenase (short-subunit alcohol dehydrogenase family)
VAASGEKGVAALMAATHSGMTTAEFDKSVSDWIATARHPKTGRLLTDMTYQPMKEVLAYLRANGFKTFIVSGGGVEFMRPWTERVYGVPPEQVVGSSGGLKYELRDGQPVLVKLPSVVLNNDKEGKPVGIQRHIGRRPIAAFGNSDGDFAMLEWTTSAPGARLGLIVHHDDAEREFAYDRKSHIGKLDRGLNEAGARVVLLDRDGAEAASAAQALAPESAQAMALDVADAQAVERVFDAVVQRHGRIDLLVNNAGVSIRKPSLELSLADWQQVLAVNLTGAFLCARAAVARMPSAGGAIVNTASIMGMSGGGPYANPAYHATKGALVNLTRAHAVEWASRGVRVNAVAPTWTETGFLRALDPTVREKLYGLMPLGRMAEPEEVATAILFLASPAASMVTGHILAVDGGFLAQ